MHRGGGGGGATRGNEGTFRGRPDAPPPRIEPVYPETVGIVGAGPAGLTAAYHLVRLGYRVTVHDANPEPGGVLAFGIPPHRLPRDILRREIADLEAMGIEFRCSTRIGHAIWEWRPYPKGCGVCVEECPRGAMAMVPEREFREEGG